MRASASLFAAVRQAVKAKGPRPHTIKDVAVIAAPRSDEDALRTDGGLAASEATLQHAVTGENERRGGAVENFPERNGAGVVTSSLAWPPPEQFLRHHPEMAAALRAQESVMAESSSRSAPSEEEDLLERTRATILRLAKEVHAKKRRATVNITINKTTMALLRIDDLRAELKYLGLDPTGQKPEVTMRILNYLHGIKDLSSVGVKLDARKALTIVDFVPSSAPAHVLSTPLGRESTNEEIMESVQRLGKLVCDKLPQTHLPSLTKSTLALVKVADLRSELELLGLDSKGPKPKVTQRLLDFFSSRSVGTSFQPETTDGRRRGTQVDYMLDEPSSVHEHLAYPGAVADSNMSASVRDKTLQKKRRGAAAAAAAVASGSVRSDAVRERKQYGQVFQPEELVAMLLKAHARNVVLVPVKDRCSWTDAMIIAEGQSLRHLEALAGAVFYQIKKRLDELSSGGQVADGVFPTVEGLKYESPEWLLVDAGNVVVHIFTQRARVEYKLEELWGGSDAGIIRYGDSPEALATVMLDDRPSISGDYAMGQLSRGAGLPADEVYIHDQLQRERAEMQRKTTLGVLEEQLNHAGSAKTREQMYSMVRRVQDILGTAHFPGADERQRQLSGSNRHLQGALGHVSGLGVGAKQMIGSGGSGQM